MATTPLAQAIMSGMDPAVYRSLQDMQQGQQFTAQSLDGSPTTGWGAMGRLASALAGSYISNGATSDLAKTVAAGKQAAAERDERMLKAYSPAAQIASPSVSETPSAVPPSWNAPSSSSPALASSDTAAPPRPPVQSSSKVWGDQEAEAAGLYEPAKPANVPLGAPKVDAMPSAAPVRIAQAPAAVQPDRTAVLREAIATKNDPYASEGSKAIADASIKAAMPLPDQFASIGDGWVMNSRTGKAERKYVPDDKTPNSVREYEYYKRGVPAGQAPMDYAAWSKSADDKTPASVKEYEYYVKHNDPGQPSMDYATWATAKARAGATNIANNVDVGATQTYDKQLAEGLGKSHAALANGVEDAQARARDVAAMQGAVDAIQKNGGTTGGMGAEQIQNLKKTINAGTNALGIEKPFNENDISEKEFLQKFNRQIAGAQAKSAVGARVTNFEMSNYLKANPGLDMSLTGNQRLLGIQAQIEQRNVEVGNAIRNATAAAISKGQRIDPVTVQKIIADYDHEHHIKDPVNGQDLTQSYTLPEFQGANMGTNRALSVGHETNISGIKIRRVE